MNLNPKNLVFFVSITCILFFHNEFKAQTTITDGNTTNIDIPMDIYYNYSYSEFIYYPSDINQAGQITEICFEYDGSAWSQDIEIFMGHTTKSEFNNNTDWVTSNGMIKVFDGSFTVSSVDGWFCIILDTPFDYNNIDNLVIGFLDKDCCYYSSSDHFYSKLTPSEYRSIYYNSDSNLPNPASPPYGGSYYYVPNLKISITPTCSANAGAWD